MKSHALATGFRSGALLPPIGQPERFCQKGMIPCLRFARCDLLVTQRGIFVAGCRKVSIKPQPVSELKNVGSIRK